MSCDSFCQGITRIHNILSTLRIWHSSSRHNFILLTSLSKTRFSPESNPAPPQQAAADLLCITSQSKFCIIFNWCWYSLYCHCPFVWSFEISFYGCFSLLGLFLLTGLVIMLAASKDNWSKHFPSDLALSIFQKYALTKYTVFKKNYLKSSISETKI